MHARRSVVFDMGGVLVDWDPRHLYRKLFDEAEEMEDFLATVCTVEWNKRQDAGRPIAEAVGDLASRHPRRAGLVSAYYDRWPEMFAGAIAGSVDILAELRGRGTPLYLLTNASGETFQLTRSLFGFLDWFPSVVVSGNVGFVKPDRRIFDVLSESHGLAFDEAVFIDDTPENVEAARRLGFQGIRFTDPEALRVELSALSLL